MQRKADTPAIRNEPTRVGFRPRYNIEKIQRMLAGISTAAEMNEFQKIFPLSVPVFKDRP